MSRFSSFFIIFRPNVSFLTIEVAEKPLRVRARRKIGQITASRKFATEWVSERKVKSTSPTQKKNQNLLVNTKPSSKKTNLNNYFTNYSNEVAGFIFYHSSTKRLYRRLIVFLYNISSFFFYCFLRSGFSKAQHF